MEPAIDYHQVIYPAVTPLHHCGMNTRENRRLNLQALLKREFGEARGAQSRLAEKLDKPQSLLSRYLALPTKPGAKVIGEDFAREVEARFRLPRNALDSDPDSFMHALSGESHDLAAFTGADLLLQTIEQRLAGVFATAEEGEPVEYCEPHEDLSEGEQEAHSGGFFSQRPVARIYGEIEFKQASRLAGDNCQRTEIDWHASVEDASPNGYWVRVPANSMLSQTGGISFPEGMLILVDPSRHPWPGHFVVAMIANEPTLRCLRRDAGQLYLVPLNPDYKTIAIENEEPIIGVVVDAKWDGLGSLGLASDLLEGGP